MYKKLKHKIFLQNCSLTPGGVVRTAAVLLCALYVSCTDPIFHQIEAEVKPKEPKIAGSPSKIVSDGTNLYTANGNIWKWDGSSWNKVDSPTNGIRDVAWADGALYALSVENVTTKLYRLDGGWVQVGNFSGYGFLQAVYGAGDQLYVSASNGNDFHVLVYRNSRLEETVFNEQIFGAAISGGKLYFAAKSAIVKFESSDDNLADPVTIAESANKSDWVGIAAGTVGTPPVETVAAVSRTGYVCIAANGRETVTKPENSYNYTGAVTFWNNGNLNYLLIGMRGSSYTNGYRELALNTEAGVEAGGYGSPSISVESPEKYNSTLGVHALTSIIQAPGGQVNGAGKPLLFASTQQNGLWSYHDVWNAEE